MQTPRRGAEWWGSNGWGERSGRPGSGVAWGRVRVAALAVLAAVFWSSPALADEIETLAGRRETTVRAIEPVPGGLRIITAEGPIDGASVRAVHLDQAKGSLAGGPVRVFLVGGDELPGTLRKGAEERIALSSPTLGALSLPIEAVRAVAYTQDPKDLARFRREIVQRVPSSDLLVLSTWEVKEGITNRVGPDQVSFELPDESVVTLPPGRVIGVRFAPLEPGKKPPAGLRARLALVDGGTVSGTGLVLGEKVCRLKTAAQVLAVPRGRVRSIWFEGGRFVYLSDLTPIKVEERSKVISIVFPHRLDGAVQGGPLRVGGRTYRKGLGVKAYTRLVYDLGGAYRALRVTVGLGDSTRQPADVVGTVRFQVLADGKPLLGTDGLLLTSEDSPKALDLPLGGAKRLELVADFGPSGDVLARGAWADAFLVR